MGHGVDLPGYEVLGVLGVGGQAAVYRARQRSVAGREVAVKVYDRSLLTERDRRRFEREVRAAASLSGHRNVVHVYETGLLSTGQPYLSMELCPGGSLSGRMREKGPLPAAEVASIGVKIGSALATAHAAGVLHRDVKPGNILLSRDAEPVLTDFGIAAVVIPGAEQSATLGLLTPAYAAPELFHGTEPSQAGDIYSLGATLYALLIGRPVRWPADREPSLVELFSLHSDPLPDVPGVAASLLNALRRAMATDPAQRYESAYQFATSLADALAAMGSAVPPAELPPPPAAAPPGPAPPATAPVRGGPEPSRSGRAVRLEPSTPDSAGQTVSNVDWRRQVDAGRPVAVTPTPRELAGDVAVALCLLAGLGVWGVATGGPAAGLALIVAALTMLTLAAFGQFWWTVTAYLVTLATAFWAAGGVAWRQPIAWLITAVAVGFAGVVVYDVRALRRFSGRALAQPRWSGRRGDRALLAALEHIPSTRFFRLPSHSCEFAVVAGDRVVLLQWTGWPSRRYTVRADRVDVGEHGWEQGTREVAGLRAELARQREWPGSATFRAFLVVRGDAGQSLTIDAALDQDVTVLPEELAEPVIGGFLAEHPYELVAPLIVHLSTVTARRPT